MCALILREHKKADVEDKAGKATGAAEGSQLTNNMADGPGEIALWGRWWGRCTAG